MFALVFWLSRRQLLSLRYALGWMGVSIAPRAWPRSCSGWRAVSARRSRSRRRACSRPSGSAFVLLITLQLSISLSGLQEAIRELSEANALLEERLARVEEEAEPHRALPPCNNAGARTKVDRAEQRGAELARRALTGVFAGRWGVRGSVRVRRVLVLCLALFGVSLVAVALAAVELAERPGRRDRRAGSRPFRVLLRDRDRVGRATQAVHEHAGQGVAEEQVRIGRFRGLARRGADALQSRARRPRSSGGHSVTTPITNADAHLLCRVDQAGRAHVAGDGDDEEPVRHGRADADRGAVALLAVVGDRHDTVEVPVGGRAARTSTRSRATRRPTRAERRRFTRPATVHLKDQFGTVATSVGAPNLLCMPTSETANPAARLGRAREPGSLAGLLHAARRLVDRRRGRSTTRTSSVSAR